MCSSDLNWIKIVTVHGHYSCPLSYKLDRFNHYMRHTKNITSYHLLVIIASNKAPVVELAKVVATNAKVISLLAL